MPYISDDPLRDFEAYEAEQDAKLAKLPHCERCGEPIMADKAIYYNDQWICADCELAFWQDIRDDFLEVV